MREKIEPKELHFIYNSNAWAWVFPVEKAAAEPVKQQDNCASLRFFDGFFTDFLRFLDFY